jgi:hypothetical protein
VAYPWATYYENFEFGWWPTMASYLLVSCGLGAIAGIIAGLIVKRSFSAGWRGVVGGAAVFAIASLLARVFGPLGFNIPGTRVRGIFFSEWRFLGFIGKAAFSTGVFAALLYAGLLRGPATEP